MLITTILFYVVARRRWHWPIAVALPIAAFFIAIDLLFFGANMLKILHGGWFPLLVSGAILFLMLTWRKGRKMLGKRMSEMTVPLELFIGDCGWQRIQRVQGTAVFMSGNTKGTPLALLHNLKHNKVLHQQVVVLTVITEESPYIAAAKDRIELEKLPEGFWRLKLHFGFMERPDVPAALARNQEIIAAIPSDEDDVFYRTRDGSFHQTPRPLALAGRPLCLDDAEHGRRYFLLRFAAECRGRTRRAGGSLRAGRNLQMGHALDLSGLREHVERSDGFDGEALA